MRSFITCTFAKYDYNDQVMEDEMGRAYSTNWDRRNACRILVGKPEGKRPVARPRCRLEDNIKMDLRELAWSDMNWMIWLRIGTSGRLL
jgi:hypothetical protein